MDWIGYLLAGIGLMAALLAWTVLYIRNKIRRGLVRTQLMCIFRAPTRISLKPLDRFEWNKGERAARRVTAFHELGFSDVGGFTLVSERSARLFVLQHPVSRLVSIVQEREPAGTWSDVAYFESGKSQPIYASNVLKKEHFYLFPGDPKIHLPDQPEAALVDSVRKALDENAIAIVITTETAKPLLEEAYATAVDARLLQPLEDWELRRLLKERGGVGEDEEITDQKLALMREQLPFVLADELRAACREQFLRETTLSAREWQQVKERLFVVHDRMDLQEPVGRFGQFSHCTPALKQALKGAASKPGSARELFARMNDGMPVWDRYKKVGQVRRPVPADLYSAPQPSRST